MVTAHYVLTTYSLRTHYVLTGLAAHCTLLPAHKSLRTAPCSQLSAHSSLLTTLCSRIALTLTLALVCAMALFNLSCGGPEIHDTILEQGGIVGITRLLSESRSPEIMVSF